MLADLEALLTILPAEMESQESGPSNADQGVREPKGCMDEGLVSSREQVRGEDGWQQLAPSQEWSRDRCGGCVFWDLRESEEPAMRPLDTGGGRLFQMGERISCSKMFRRAKCRRRAKWDKDNGASGRVGGQKRGGLG